MVNFEYFKATRKSTSGIAENLIFKWFEEGAFLGIQDDVPFPDLELDTFPVPLEARIALWL